MRKVICSFLILIMLVPSLACGVLMFTKQASAAENVRPCKMMVKQQDQGTDKDLMIFKDCSGVDLSTIHHDTSVKAPDTKIQKVVYAWVGLTATSLVSAAHAYETRGPPWIDEVSFLSPPNPLYLTTQRIRI